ncbi:PadR family transcriptional regulator [Demequina mangrovi]|uniref:Transcriptional regulator, PadR family n=1 Tax=Demequina mangrovi TaxID=1043493 RepID=A0A1H6UTW6_9MICO|nr:PadR family transcriptional regulator [Demequina mangrovi]SEI91750.1 transcriptional regulator, PadR family [Demequina mangrovi]
MKGSHQHHGPRGMRGLGPHWADASEERGDRSMGRRGGFGPGAHDGPDPGAHGPGGGRHGGHGRGRGRHGGRPRGDVRAAILLLLAEQPRHGYDLIRAIEERSGGAWVPSPGSIYPTLQALEDEGLVAIDVVEGRKTAALTEAGAAWTEDNAAQLDALFEVDDRERRDIALRREMGALRDAAIHVSRQADEATGDRAVEILAAARRDLYRLLADDAG